MAKEIAQGPHLDPGTEVKSTAIPPLLLLLVIGLIVLLVIPLSASIRAKPIALAETFDFDFPATQISVLSWS